MSRVFLWRGLPSDSAGYQFDRVDGGWAVQANSAAKIGCEFAGSAVPRPPYQRWIVDNQGMVPWSVTLERA